MLKLKVLIVDDEKDYCSLMKTYFEEKNYEVFLATNLAQAFQKIDQNPPDILFLDNNLPDGRGWNHISEFMKKNPGVKLYLVSAYNQKLNLLPSSNIIIWEKPISLKLLNQYF
jgi:two-component system OmpR family response regulator